jgi:hypothetical protein
LTVVGAIAVVAGSLGMIYGAAGVIGPSSFSRNVDSEFRFYAAWYVVAGLLLLWAVPRVERERGIVFAVAAGFFLAACGRVLSILDVGAPDRFYVVLTIIEFVLPPVIVPLQILVLRRAAGGEPG